MMKLQQMIASAMIIALTVTIVGALQTYVHAEAEVEGPRYGGTLVVAETVYPNIFINSFEASSFWWYVNSIYDQLVKMDINCEIQPGLAKSWEISPDGLTYTFHLYENASWHDGVPFTSADVKFTYETHIAQNGLQAYELNLFNVNEIETPGNYTVIIKLKEVDATFLWGLGNYGGQGGILAKHIYEGANLSEAKNWYPPIGTGPFKWVPEETVANEYITMVANEKYHKGRPYIDKLVWKIIPDRSVAQFQLETGEIHYMCDPPPLSECVRMMENPEINVVTRPFCVDATVLMLNHRVEVLNNTKVRQALAYAIDRKELNDKAFFGLSKVAEGMYSTIYPSVIWAFNPDTELPEYNPEIAEGLLDEAGYPRGTDGIRFTLNLLSPLLIPELDVANQVVKEQLAKVGISVRTETMEYMSWWTKVIAGHDFEMALFLFYSSPDPAYGLRAISQTEGIWASAMGYSNPRVDELHVLAVKTMDREERKTYYYEMQGILRDEMPYVPVIQYLWPNVKRADWHGFSFEEGSIGNIYDFSKVWWESGVLPTPAPSPTPTPGPTPEPTPAPTPAPPPPEVFPMEYVAAAVVIIVIVIIAAALLMKRRK